MGKNIKFSTVKKSENCNNFLGNTRGVKIEYVFNNANLYLRFNFGKIVYNLILLKNVNIFQK